KCTFVLDVKHYGFRARRLGNPGRPVYSNNCALLYFLTKHKGRKQEKNGGKQAISIPAAVCLFEQGAR
ncbi:MAG: hypothetical protein IJ365_07875, partial [Clostridia bacterium]|nr:hypothetical protein [Clostridia bacterium]